LAGCGGGGPPAEKVVQGTGFRFSAPADWEVVRKDRTVQASQGTQLVSVTRSPLLRRFRPELWDEVVPELDRVASGLAQQQNGKVGSSQTVTIAGRKARRYDIDYTEDGKQLVERIAFVLRGKTAYELLCRYDRRGSTDACDRLLATFTLD
jgi:hypothetical protein